MKSLTALLLPLALISHAALAIDPVLDNKPLGPSGKFVPFSEPIKYDNEFVKPGTPAPAPTNPAPAPATAPATAPVQVNPPPTAKPSQEAPAPTTPAAEPVAPAPKAPDDKFGKTIPAPVVIDKSPGAAPIFTQPGIPPLTPAEQKAADDAVIDEHFGKGPKDPSDYVINPQFTNPIGLDPITLQPVPTKAPEEKAPVGDPDKASAPGPREPITLYAAGNYRLRTGPWKHIQLIIPRGAKFSLIRKEGEWYVVEYNGKTGYVHESGITHPLAQALRKQKAFAGLTENQAAEIAACVSQVDSSGLPRDLQEFVQKVQAELLPYIDAVEPDQPAGPSQPDPKPTVAKSEAPKKGAAKPDQREDVEAKGVMNPKAKPAPKPAAAKPDPKKPATRRDQQRDDFLQAEAGAAPPQGAAPRPTARKPARSDPDAPSDKPLLDTKKVTRGSVTARGARLAEACWQAVNKYRLFAPHVCKRRGEGYPCGGSNKPYKSKGWCGAGSKECLSQAIGLNLSGVGDSFASKKRTLDRMTTKAGVSSCEAAPVNTVCIYTASYHSFGHIEVKILHTDPRSGVKRIMYCSDYCADHPVKRNHTFQGAYLP